MTSTMIKNQEELFTRNYILPGWTGGFSAGFIFPENNSAGANKFCIQKGEGGAKTKINPREAGREKFKEGMIRNMPCTGKNIRKGEKKVRRPRYAFQTRSQVDVLDDGYRWRKYGQKAVKNNKFPRSYYRCTQQDCTVKKQVQRLSKDEGIVVTTYEGMHTHPVEKSSDNFEQILSQMQIYAPF